MATATTVPLTITPEAAARVSELGMQPDLEEMLDHTRRVVPGLHGIRVVLAEPYDTGDEPRILIEALMDDPHRPDDPTETAWGRWLVGRFAPTVCQHFCMLTCYAPAHER